MLKRKRRGGGGRGRESVGERNVKNREKQTEVNLTTERRGRRTTEKELKIWRNRRAGG